MKRRWLAPLVAVALCAPAAALSSAPAHAATTCTITQDASNPAAVNGTQQVNGNSIQTASFTPPAGSLLEAVIPVDVAGPPTVAISDSVGHTWTLKKSAYSGNDGAYIYSTSVTSSAPETVKLTITGTAWSATLDVRVLDGAATDQTGAGSSSAIGSGTGLVHGITTTQTGSWVLIAANANTQETSVTSNSLTTLWHNFQDSTGNSTEVTGRQKNATTTPGTETLGWTLAPNSTQLALALQEVIPAQTCGGTQQAPAVTTTAATGLTSTGATLNGTVNPNGAATTYQFQYGTTTSYGSVAPASPGSAGSGTTAVNESAAITGLNASTTYHYRLTATNSAGTTNGADQQLTTTASGGTHFMDFGPSAACPNGSGSGCTGNPNAYPLNGTTCANSIVPQSEQISENATANATAGPTTVAAANYGPFTDNTGEPQMQRDIQAASGQYTGTTGDILEWAACSEGWNEDWARAESVIESSWQQSEGGDTANGCAHSYGILQVRDNGSVCPPNHDGWGGYPFTHTSTAFAAEMQMSYLRACFDGSIDYLYPGGQTVAQIAAANGGGANPTGAGWQYVAWGCVGSWFTGEWGWINDSNGGPGYIANVKSALANRSWTGLS